MIDEKLMPLVEAVDRATGRRPHLSTVLRWCTKGNVRLESRILGGRRLTSVDAVLRYIEASTLARDGHSTPVTTPRQQTLAANRAAKKLAARVG